MGALFDSDTTHCDLCECPAELCVGHGVAGPRSKTNRVISDVRFYLSAWAARGDGGAHFVQSVVNGQFLRTANMSHSHRGNRGGGNEESDASYTSEDDRKFKGTVDHAKLRGHVPFARNKKWEQGCYVQAGVYCAPFKEGTTDDQEAGPDEEER